jgi:hypothetical protein
MKLRSSFQPELKKHGVEILPSWDHDGMFVVTTNDYAHHFEVKVTKKGMPIVRKKVTERVYR